MSEAGNTVQTQYGRLDRAALNELQHSFDIADLMRVIDELDAMLAVAKAQDGLREMLLHLHRMAHSVVSGVGMSAVADQESLPELANDVATTMLQMASTVQRWSKLVEPVERLGARN